MLTRSALTALLATTLLSLPAPAPAQAVIHDWLITPASAASTGNTWMTTTNSGHGIDFISKDAATNTLKKDVIVVSNSDSPTGALQVIIAATGQRNHEVTMTPTGDSFRDHFRIATSDDGFIFVAGAEGTIQAYSIGGGPPFNLISRTAYTSLTPAVGVTCRALDVSGSLLQGSARVFVARGGDVVVFQNSFSAPLVFSYVGHFNTGVTGDLVCLAESAGSLYASSVPNPQLRKFQLTYSPSFAALPVNSVAAYNNVIKNGIALDSSATRAAVHISGSSLGDQFAIAQITGTQSPVFTNIPALSSLDRTGDGIYDGGSTLFTATSGTPDVCMDPLTGDVYGYCPGTAQGALMKIRASSSPVAEWMVY